MKIQYFYINNFKSLLEFELALNDFSCLIGLNGSGKSTVLHALDFIAHLMAKSERNIPYWLENRQWKASDLSSKFSDNQLINFRVDFISNDNLNIRWEGCFDSKEESLYCIEENISIDKKMIFKVKDKVLYKEYPNSEQDLLFEYKGSLLSVLLLSHLYSKRLAGIFKDLKNFVSSIQSLDLLAPHYLRKNSHPNHSEMGLGGQNLASLLSSFDKEKYEKLKNLLYKNYPNLKKIHIIENNSGWKNIKVDEIFNKKTIQNNSLHLNDGMLRMIAIFAQTLTKDNFLLFDEIENGINPERIEMLMDHLVETKQQILVTTHSPMILNYIDDIIAIKAVQLIYKTNNGYTQVIPFFSIPSIRKKLKVMGPGEAFIDTDLIQVHKEIQSLNQE